MAKQLHFTTKNPGRGGGRVEKGEGWGELKKPKPCAIPHLVSALLKIHLLCHIPHLAFAHRISVLI